MQLSSKNDDSSLCYDVIITHQKILKLINLVIFRTISIITVGQTYLEMLSPLYLTNVTPGDRREPLADTNCPPAAQRKQAKRACIYIYIYRLIEF